MEPTAFIRYTIQYAHWTVPAYRLEIRREAYQARTMNDDWAPGHYYRQAADPLASGRGQAGPCPADEPGILDTLQHGEIIDCRLIPWGSNYTFAATVKPSGGASLIAVYKPRLGEAPLWDFTDGTLCQREYAAYVLSLAFGWHFIPPTVLRDGPHGPGTLQLYVEPGATLHDRALRRTHVDTMRQVAVFDLLTNNADRKAGHCFTGRHDGRLWGIDHGLTFHVHPKLRTVIWEFSGEPVPDDLLAPLRAVQQEPKPVRTALAPHLVPNEIDMLFIRIDRLLANPLFPVLNSRRNIPYGW